LPLSLLWNGFIKILILDDLRVEAKRKIKEWYFWLMRRLLVHTNDNTEIRRLLAMTNAQLFASTVIFGFFSLNVFFGQYALLPIIGSAFAVIVFSFLLVLRGRFDAAKLLLLIFISTSHFVSSSSMGPDAGNILIYFPLLSATFLFFDRKKRWQITVVTVYLSLQMFLLEFTSFKLFDLGLSITRQHNHANYYIILFVSIFLCVLFIYELIEINRASQAKMEILNKKLRRRNRNLSKAIEELDHFVYRASHDMRSPLRSILGLTSIMRLENNVANFPELIDKLEKSTKKLDVYVLEVLDMSRNAKTQVEAKEIDLKSFIWDIFGKLEYMVGNQGIDFDFTCQGERFYSDPGRLQIVLSNLVGNSIKYSKPDKAIVCSLKMRVTVGDDSALFVLEDNGVGISKEHLPHVFDMFYRANEQSDGSGLGLYIVKEVVEKLNGTIGVESEKGEWTRVSLTIPNLNKAA
jgi:signal transduction histidine kinase